MATPVWDMGMILPISTAASLLDEALAELVAAREHRLPQLTTVRIPEGVEVLAEVRGHPVVVRQGSVLAVSFHPELTGDGRLHSLLVEMAQER